MELRKKKLNAKIVMTQARVANAKVISTTNAGHVMGTVFALLAAVIMTSLEEQLYNLNKQHQEVMIKVYRANKKIGELEIQVNALQDRLQKWEDGAV